MSPRPRKPKHKGLPPNLYPDIKNGVTYYRYRRPDDGSWHPMGKDKLQAVAAAKQLNSILMQGADLVAKVMGENKEIVTLADFITIFSENEIPKRKWAKDTVSLFNIRVRQINEAFGNKSIDEITIRNILAF